MGSQQRIHLLSIGLASALLAVTCLVYPLAKANDPNMAGGIQWKPWSNEAFEEAKRTRLVGIVIDIMLGDDLNGWDLVGLLKEEKETSGGR